MKTILEIGREYHCWTVLRFDRVDERRRRRYWCQCQCGAEKSLAASAVAAGRTKQCTKCKRSKLKGRHFYQWEVLEPLGVDAHHHTIWLCRCQCGKECTVSGGNLIKGASRCCFDCGHKKKMQTKVIPEVWWYKTIRQAEARDISWEISEEQAQLLESGRLAIVERPEPGAIEHSLVPSETAEKILALSPKSVRFFNRRGPPIGFSS